MRLLPLLALGLIAAPGAFAQDAAAPAAPAAARVLHDVFDEVKLPDGSTATWRFTTTYDPATGETAYTVTDAAGQVVERTTSLQSVVAPTPEEHAAAMALIRADPEVMALMSSAREVMFDGGFPLVREAGHPCGPGSRCLQFDLADATEDVRNPTRLRYIVVDLRTNTVVSNDFDPAREGNLANPAEPAR